MDLNKLNSQELDVIFLKAYKAVSETNYKFKQDTLLYFYAYYKHATKDFNINLKNSSKNGEQLVNAFKSNALFQVKHLTIKESKKKYIQLTIQYLGKDFL